jgi:hypothetical protein
MQKVNVKCILYLYLTRRSLDSLPGMRVRAGSTGSTGSPARMRRQATTTAATTETAVFKFVLSMTSILTLWFTLYH